MKRSGLGESESLASVIRRRDLQVELASQRLEDIVRARRPTTGGPPQLALWEGCRESVEKIARELEAVFADRGLSADAQAAAHAVRERDEPVAFVADQLSRASAPDELTLGVAVNDIAPRKEVTNHELSFGHADTMTGASDTYDRPLWAGRSSFGHCHPSRATPLGAPSGPRQHEEGDTVAGGVYRGGIEKAADAFVHEEFLRQALDPRACFVCGEFASGDGDTREHVFPRWMQKDFDLWDQKLTLLNRTPMPYRQVTITCCESCRRALNPLETEISKAFRLGVEAVRSLDAERLYLWMAKFYYGLLFRELDLQADRSRGDLGTIMTKDSLRSFEVHHLLLRRLLGEVTWRPFPATILVFEAMTSDDPRLNFDYFDVVDQPFLTMRCGPTFVIGWLQDFGAVGHGGVLDWQQVVAASELKLHPLQCTELTAMGHTIVLNHRPPKLLVSNREDHWHVAAIDRGEGMPTPFDDWDPALYEWVFRGVLEVTRGTEVIHQGSGVPSFIFDQHGKPFQAPRFDWAPPTEYPPVAHPKLSGG